MRTVYTGVDLYVVCLYMIAYMFFFFKQKTAYEMRISDWSSDVCSSDLKTAEVIRNGWFHTGDIGSIDADGQMMFHGRTKDMLKVGGENVAAAEIEARIQTHPAVKREQVVGIPPDRIVVVPEAFGR